MFTQEVSRRKMLQLLGASALGMAVASCGATSASNGPYKGKFVIMSANDPNQNKEVIQAIEKAHPGVKVTWRNLTSEQYTQLFTAAEVAGDQIDIMDLNGQDLRRYAVGNKLKDLSGLSYKSRFRPIGLKTYTIDGKLWALPRGGISGFTFFYNKKLLDQAGVTSPPQSYDDLKTVNQALGKIGIPTFATPGKDIYLWPIWYFWAHGQTSKNQSAEYTFQTLAGHKKFTDPESVAALEIIAQFAKDNMYIKSVNSLDSNASLLLFTQGKAAFYYAHSSIIGTYRQGNYPALDLALVPPVLSVSDTTVKRQMPGGTGDALGIYAKVDASREQVAYSILDLMTSDNQIKKMNIQGGDPVSCNANVQASSDPLALSYSSQCAPNQTIYLDWYWPPEVTTAFQQNIQGIVAGSTTSTQAAQSVQQTLDQLRQNQGYTFQV